MRYVVNIYSETKSCLFVYMWYFL